jgi:F0F1-type ATP synthase membrane subunit a
MEFFRWCNRCSCLFGVMNVISIIPYTFSVTSQIIVTSGFALLVFFTVVIYGFYKKRPAISQDFRSFPAFRSTYCRWSS